MAIRIIGRVRFMASDEETHKPFDLEFIYDEKINPLMVEIIAICKEHRLPMLATFLYAIQEDGGEDYCTSSLHFEDGRDSDNLREAQRALLRKSTHAFAIPVTKASQ